jgi:hypothetical protein
MLIFFPPKFCHSETGYSIHLAYGTLYLRRAKNVDFPQPIFPSIVKQNWVPDSGLRLVWPICCCCAVVSSYMLAI